MAVDAAIVYCPVCWWQARVFADKRQISERYQCCPMCGAATRMTEVGSPGQVDEPATAQQPAGVRQLELETGEVAGE